MTDLIIALSECTNQREVDRVIEKNIKSVTPFICSFANDCKRRIQRERKINLIKINPN